MPSDFLNSRETSALRLTKRFLMRRISYDKMMEVILKVDDIAQIFTLNNKLFLQVENDVRMFGNKNIDDALRKEAGCASKLDYAVQTSWLP